ncbi:MAG: YgdI/YgdR family lipoprotein [Limisphaerales bacterium]
MKRLLLALLLGSTLFTGCASNYVVIVDHGKRITTAGKPHLEGRNYVFTDLNGRTYSVASGRVRSIKPAPNKPSSK